MSFHPFAFDFNNLSIISYHFLTFISKGFPNYILQFFPLTFYGLKLFFLEFKAITILFYSFQNFSNPILIDLYHLYSIISLQIHKSC